MMNMYHERQLRQANGALLPLHLLPLPLNAHRRMNAQARHGGSNQHGPTLYAMTQLLECGTIPLQKGYPSNDFHKSLLLVPEQRSPS
jgi:hypothetical protein